MSQPYKRGANVPQPGKIDSSLQEYWVANPWDIVDGGHNLSNYERQRFFLNVKKGKAFLDLSFLSGADRDSDGRAVVAADFRGTGQLDLIVRHSGGGPIVIYENRFPIRHFLQVSLRGRKSNSLGIGARLTAMAGGQQLVRELYPQNSFLSQMPSNVHFGLADATKVDRLEIRWPSGEVQVLTDLPADRHILVDEGKQGPEAIRVVTRGVTVAP